VLTAEGSLGRDIRGTGWLAKGGLSSARATRPGCAVVFPVPTTPDLHGILVFDKPLGWSSMKAVAAVRRRAGGVRTGHAGTLDPLATGVLVLALGRATRFIEHLMDTEKRYRTIVDLSAFTTTDDLEGARTDITVSSPPTHAALNEVLRRFVGTIQQRPPAFSAMKVGGRRAYRLARAGREVDLPPRPVVVRELRCLRYEWPNAELDIRSGKGFYVRSLARELGQALGTGGHCATLRRTAVGPFDEKRATTVQSLPERLACADLLPIEEALALLGSV
jgi:tRNA pseudouridine55 synthase